MSFLKYSNSEKSSICGAMLPLFAILISVLCVLLAGVIDFSTMDASRKQAESLARNATLYALKEFFAHECVNLSIDQCDNEKLAVAAAAASSAFQLTPLIAKNNSDVIIKPFYSTPDDSHSNSPIGTALTLQSVRYISGDEATTACGGQPSCTVARKTGQNANALLLDGNIGNYLRSNTITKVLSFGETKAPLHLVATNVPKHGVVIVDISASMVYQSYQDWEQFSYCLAADNAGVGFGDDDAWIALNKYAPDRSHPLTGYSHYASDYRKITTFSDASYASMGDAMKYFPNPNDASNSNYRTGAVTCWIDAFSEDSSTPPEPLSSVFDGLKALVAEFNSRAVPGDLVGFVFYDGKLAWPRTILPTKDFSYVDTLLDTNPSNLRAGSYVDSGLLQLAHHQIFPGVSGFTDTINGLSAATLMLAGANDQGKTQIPSSEFIVHISDGLVNCADGVAGGRCNNDYAHYSAAMAKLTQMATDTLKPGNIPFHTIIVGPAAHTVDVMDSSTNTCLTDDQARSRGYSNNYIRGGYDGSSANCGSTLSSAFAGTAQGCKFLQAVKDFYNISLITRGVFVPIRTSTSCVPSACSNGQIRYTDPQCRSTNEQVKDAVSKIMGQVAFAIVETNGSTPTSLTTEPENDN